MKSLKIIMKIVMNWTKKITIIFFILSITFLVISWSLKSFQLLMLAIVLLMSSLTIKFEKIRTFMLPIISVGFILTIAEFLIPVLTKDYAQLVKYDPESGYTSGGYYQRVPGFGYRLTPGKHTSKKLTASGETIYDVIYTIGPDGYRKDVDTNSYDGYIYGGSYAFGEGLNDNQTISYYLYHQYNISTKNMGVHGFGLQQALYNIQQGIESHMTNGINILLTAPWHSLRSSCKKSYSNGTPRYILKNGSLQLEGVCKYRSHDSILSKVLSKSNVIKLFKHVNNNENVITDNDIDLYLEIIREIKKLSKQKNMLLIIAYIDAANDRLSATKWTNESLIAELENIADDVIDVSLTDKRKDLESKFYIHDLDQHPSALANKQRSKILHSVFK